MRKLSIFVDESGDFGEIKERPAYYLVTFVLHDKDISIEQNVKKLEESIKTAGFDKMIVYYDNGQSEFRKVQPQKYKLLQVADFICTMELLKIKKNEKRLSRSEEQFFYKPQELKKTFLKSLEKKKL